MLDEETRIALERHEAAIRRAYGIAMAADLETLAERPQVSAQVFDLAAYRARKPEQDRA